MDPYFLCRKKLRNGIELRQDLYLRMLKIGIYCLLAIFPTVFSFRFASFSTLKKILLILRVLFLETLDSIT